MPTELKAWDPRGFLRLNDIALWSATFERGKEYQPALHENRMGVQARSAGRYEILEVIDGNDGSADFLRAIIGLGVRAVVSEGEDRGDVLFSVEAEFAVTYQIEKMPDEAVFDQFVKFNCVHNAWPFWRQHVYDTTKRASLPLIEIPLFCGADLIGEEVESD